MVLITSLLQTTSFRLPLCLLYPSNPRTFPNLNSFPSNSHLPPPPSLPFAPDTSPTKVKTSGKAFHELFSGCNDLPLDRKIFFIKKARNTWYLLLLLKYFVRIREHVLVPNQSHCNITIHISHQPQNCLLYICTLSHLCVSLLGFEP
jgi:hypothetical protein